MLADICVVDGLARIVPDCRPDLTRWTVGREVVDRKVRRVCSMRLEQLLAVLVALLVLVPDLAPLRDHLAVEDEDVKEGVEKGGLVGLDGDAVEQHKPWRDVERVRHERGLDHDV